MKRRERREMRNREIKTERRKRAQHVLEALGIWSDVQRSRLGELLLNQYYAPIHISLAKGLDKLSQAKSIMRKLETVLHGAKFDFPLIGEWPILDYFMHVKPITSLLGQISAKYSHTLLEAHLNRLKPLIESSVADAALDRLYCEFLDRALIHYNRINQEIYFLKWN